jgi:hypothetical protein
MHEVARAAPIPVITDLAHFHSKLDVFLLVVNGLLCELNLIGGQPFDLRISITGASFAHKISCSQKAIVTLAGNTKKSDPAQKISIGNFLRGVATAPNAPGKTFEVYGTSVLS